MNNIAHRIVHFDLKGAPWKVPYLKQVIAVAKQWGVTGVLFEWEDSFPYTGRLVSIGSLGGSSRDGLYSDEEIKELLQFTANTGLEPIQLVQSIGHLEFVLKHDEFAHMREMTFFPSVLCPTRPGGKELVIAMIKQALSKQPDAKFIHIGADEAWYLNKCPDCVVRTNNGDCVDFLFITHIKAIVTEIRKTYPQIHVLIWDDMMRSMQEESLIASEMSQYVIPVVWHYQPVGGFHLDVRMWEKYEKCFFELWVASAFKGANTSCSMIVSTDLYVSNQEAWIQQLRQLEGRSMLTTGIILTGWSRYDHYATLCELLPVALPCLARCLKMWVKSDAAFSELSLADEFPGAAAARCVHDWDKCREECLVFLRGATVNTWLNPWQLAHGYTTPIHVKHIADTAQHLVTRINIIREELSCHLHGLTGPRSAAEWLRTNVEPLGERMARLASGATERANVPASVTPAVIPKCETEKP